MGVFCKNIALNEKKEQKCLEVSWKHLTFATAFREMLITTKSFKA